MTLSQDVRDVRLLKLAEMYEVAYEGFVLEIAQRVVKDADVRSTLLRLAGGPRTGVDHHERVVRELERLNAALPQGAQPAIDLAAVQDVLECERAAHEFYLERVEEAHDPRVRALFRDLAKEEAGHIAIAQAAFDLAQRRARAVSGVDSFSYPSSLAAEDENGVLLREGVMDFGSAPAGDARTRKTGP